jgi:hypothetical protein
MKRKLESGLGQGLLALALLALAAGCDRPFAPPENPRAPALAQPLPEKPAATYISYEEMMNLYEYLVNTSRQAQVGYAKISRQKKAGDQNWLVGWGEWKVFTGNNDRIIEVKRSLYDLPGSQGRPGNPVPCLHEALTQLDMLINYYGRNLGQDFPLGPDADVPFTTKLAQCKQLLDKYEPPEEFGGAPPPKIK